MSKGDSVAPQWQNPAPQLDSMPAEILEMIFEMAIPDRVNIIATNEPQLGSHGQARLCWSPEWVQDLMLLNKSVRKVVQKALITHVEVHFLTSHRETWTKSRPYLDLHEAKSIAYVYQKVLDASVCCEEWVARERDVISQAKSGTVDVIDGLTWEHKVGGAEAARYQFLGGHI